MKKKLVVPKFNNEDDEAKWWNSLKINEYFEPSDFKRFALDDLLNKHNRPKTKRISIRIPEVWIDQAKKKAAQLDIPYQSLLKQFISKGLQVEQ